MDTIPEFALLREAAYFVALAECGNLRAAGMRFGVTAEAVRDGVRKLATHSHRPPLFVGTGRQNVELTPIGHQFLPLARRLIDHANLMADDTIRLRLSTYPRIAARAAAAVGVFHASKLSSGARVWYHDLSNDHRRDGGRNLVRRAALGEIDLVIAPSGASWPSVAPRDAYASRLRVVLPRGRRAPKHRDTIAIEDVDGLSVISTPTGHASRELLQKAYDEAERLLAPVLELTDMGAARLIAAQSDNLVAFVLSDARENHESPESIGPLLVDSQGAPYTQMYAVYRSSMLDTSPLEGHQARQSVLKVLARMVRNELRKFDDPLFPSQ